MSYKHISVEPLTPTIGATIRDVDLTQPLDDTVFEEIHQAWMDHLVIFFRDQDITHQEQINFSKCFGPIEKHAYVKGLP